MWRLQEREVMSMPVYKDEKRNTWFCKCNYKDWLGESKSKMKRGFATNINVNIKMYIFDHLKMYRFAYSSS